MRSTTLAMERSSYAIPKELMERAHGIWTTLSRMHALPVKVEKHRESKNALVTAALQLFVEEQAARLVELETAQALAADPGYRKDFLAAEAAFSVHERELPDDGFDYRSWAPKGKRRSRRS